jgi:hypothetical protein
VRPAFAVATVLAAAGFAPAALASLPPGKRALVDFQRQSVGAIRVGEPLIKLSFAWSPPDFGAAANPVAPEPHQQWGNSPALPWAVVSFSDAEQQHATAIFYRGPFRTAKGDMNGTSLATVLRHWPSHGSPTMLVSPLIGTAPYLRVPVGSSSFYFDATKRLVAIQVGDGTAALWANERR